MNDQSALLKQFLKVSDEVNRSETIEPVLNATCEAAVNTLQVNHSALVLFDEARQEGRVAAEYPTTFGALGRAISLLEPIERRLIRELKPIAIQDLSSPDLEQEFGSVMATLRSLRIRSILIVPIVCKGRAVGSFSLDITGHGREFTNQEIIVAEIFAAQIAAAVDNQLWTRRTQDLRNAVLALSRTRSKENVIDIVVRHAMSLLDGTGSGLYEWNAASMDLRLVADRSQNNSVVIGSQEDERLAARLITSNDRIVTICDDLRLTDAGVPSPALSTSKSVIAARLQAPDGRPYGVLCVVDTAQRQFTDVDRRLFALFVDHASAALDAVSAAESDYSSTTVALLDASATALVSGASLTEGCERLAEILAERLSALFCRIVLHEGDLTPSVLGVALDPSVRRSLARDLRLMTQDKPTLGANRLRSLGVSHSIVETQEARNLFPHAAINRLDRVLLIALKAGGEVIGVIEIGFPDKREAQLDDDQIGKDLSERLGALFAKLVERESSLKQLDVVRRALECCKQAGLNGGNDGLANHLIRMAAEIVGAQAAQLFSWSDENSKLSFLAEYGDAQREVPNLTVSDACRRGLVESLPASPELPQWANHSLVVPLKLGGFITHAFWLWLNSEAAPTGDTKALISTYGEFVAAALSPSTPLRNERFGMVVAKIGQFLIETNLESKVLAAGLTAITASWGLRFNRAGVFLLNDSGQELVAAAGIGELEKAKALRHWKTWNHSQHSSIDGYLSWIRNNSPEESDIGRAIQGLVVPVNQAQADCFSRVLFAREPEIVENPGDRESLIDAYFIQAFQPASPLYVVPVISGTRSIGVLVADNRFVPALVTEESTSYLRILANMVGGAIERLREQHSGAVSSSFGSPYSMPRDPRAYLAEAIERLRRRENAQGATLFLADDGSLLDIVSAGTPVSADLAHFKWEGSLTARVMNSPHSHTVTRADFGNEFPTSSLKPVRSLAIPVHAEEDSVGTLWLHFDRKKDFDEQSLRRLQTLARGIGIEYRNRLAWSFELGLADVIERLARASTLNELSAEIATAAKTTFACDMATVWPYDKATDSFQSDECGTSGWPLSGTPGVPQFGRTTYGLLVGAGYRAERRIELLEDEWPPGTGEITLASLGFSSFQGIALQTDGEPNAILYLTYRKHRTFTTQDERNLRRFARITSLALQRVRLTSQSKRLNEATRLLTELAGTPGRAASLNAIASRVRDAIGSQSVVIYGFDQERQDFDYPPGFSAGLKHVAMLRAAGRLPEHSLVRHLMRRELPYLVPDVSADDLFRDRRFTRDEGVGACLIVALSLPASRERVGVMFINYAKPRVFSKSDIDDVQFLASQAAMLSRDLQMRAVASGLARQQDALVTLGGKMLTAATVEKALGYCVDCAANEFEAEFSNIVLPRHNELIFVQGVGWPESFRNTLRIEPGAMSHAGFTINENRPVVVDDFDREVRFIVPARIPDNRIRSGVGVPMRFGSEVVGALLVHTRTARHFTSNECVFLSVVGSQAAMAIRHMGRTDSIEHWV
jgi:GAF domain-containing protein